MSEQENAFSDTEEFDLDGKILKPVLVKCDIPKEIRRRSFILAFEAMNKFSVEKDISDYIKTIFDKEFLPTWQCVVGKLNIFIMIYFR
jgi:Dynein light chain type 1